MIKKQTNLNQTIGLVLEQNRKLAERSKADIAEPDGTIEDQCEQAWLDEADRRHLELIEGKVQAIPGDEVFARLQSRL